MNQAWRRRCLRACIGVFIGACLNGLGPAAWAQSAGAILSLDRADATFEPDGLPPRRAAVALSHRWDDEFPGRDGRALYRLSLPPRDGDEPMALLITRIGNQAVVRVNGQVLSRLGELGQPQLDAAKTSHLLSVPAALLQADRANALEVEVTSQSQRWGGLSLVQYGPQAQMERLYDGQRVWRHLAAIVFAGALGLLGLLAAALWWRQRDALYGCFALASLLGMVRHLDRIWPDLPVPWPLWGAIAATCYAWHLALVCRFSLMAVEHSPPRLVRSIHLYMALAALAATVAFLGRQPMFWTAALALLAPLGLACFWVVALRALQARSRIAWVVLAASAIAVLAGLHDLGLVRMGFSKGTRFSVLPYALFLHVLIMGAIVVERYTHTLLGFRALSASLAERVAQREAELRQAFQLVESQQREQATQLERQRLMREIHDGVGAHLVGLLSLLAKPGAAPAQMKEHVQAALDDMRMAVDSLQPVHGDLTTVLATLRYRLQPRLEAAGIEVVWEVAELPSLGELPAQAVLQIQRILLEGFTNILKHARAGQVRVKTEHQVGPPPRLVLSLTDDGVGLPADTSAVRGQGLNNMRSRAQAIDASLTVANAAGGGTCVALAWALPSPGQPAGASAPVG